MLRVNLKDKEIIVTNIVIEILKFHQGCGTNEEGGILLGQVSESESRILVCRASLSGEYDTSRKFSFRRDAKNAQRIIDYEFNNSGGRNTYLGEWHTHPSMRATPSAQDIRMINEQLVKNDLMIDFILLFVVAQRELFIGIYDGQELVEHVVNDFELKDQS